MGLICSMLGQTEGHKNVSPKMWNEKTNWEIQAYARDNIKIS
jgi:hypothetical protein